MTSKSKSKDDEWSFNFHEDSSQETSSQELERSRTASNSAQLTTDNNDKNKYNNLTEEEILIAEAEVQDVDEFTLGLNGIWDEVEDFIDIGMVKEGNIKVSDNPFTKAKVIGRMRKRNREDVEDNEALRGKAEITPSIPTTTKSCPPSVTINNSPNPLQKGFARQAEVYGPKPKKKSRPSNFSTSSKPKRVAVVLNKIPVPSTPTKGMTLKPSSFQTALTSHRPLDTGSSSSPIRSSRASNSRYLPTFAPYKPAKPFYTSSEHESLVEEIDDSDGETDSISILSTRSIGFNSSHSTTSNNNSSSPSTIARMSPIKLPSLSKLSQNLAQSSPRDLKSFSQAVASQAQTQTRLIPFNSSKSKIPSSSSSSSSNSTSPLASTSMFTLPTLVPSAVLSGVPKVLFKPTESLKDYKARLAKEEKLEKEVAVHKDHSKSERLGEDEEKIIFGTNMRAFKPLLGRRKRSLPRRVGEVGKRTQVGEGEVKEGERSAYGKTFDW